MAQTFTISAMGSSANAGDGNGIRTGGLKIATDLTELYADIATLQGSVITAASLMRVKAAESCNGSAGQVIAFSSQFASVYGLIIIDYQGIGIDVTAQDEDGFTITSLSSGNFAYVALIEV